MTALYCVTVHLENGYASLTVKDRMAWTKHHATKLARDWKAQNMRDAWTEEAQGYETHAAPRTNAFRPR